MAPVIAECSDDLNDESQIQKFYENKSVMLTGGTGFLGKVLTEKLLRSTDVARIYLLIRSKKDKDINERLDDIFEDPLFGKLEKDKPKFRSRISLVTGDCALPGLGLSKQDRQLIIDNVEILIHGAATVRFTEPLKMAIATNVRGTMEIINLSKEIRNLKSLVHISTAFSNCTRKAIDEKFYKSNIPGELACQMIEHFDSDFIDTMSQKMLGKFPNTYTFTKSLAEDLIMKQSEGLPVTVFRPCVVLPTYEEPFPGWIDNYYGPTSILTGVAAGVLRVFYCDVNILAHIVPVDYCSNAIIATAWKTAENFNVKIMKEPTVYNFVPHNDNLVKWDMYRRVIVKYGTTMPLSRMLWYPCYTLTSSKLMYKILSTLYHILPALFMDFFLLLSRKKVRMLKVYRKIHLTCQVLDYFTEREWQFSSENVNNLWDEISPTDKSLFKFNMLDVDWNLHFERSTYGLRTYLVKDDPSTIPKAIKLYKKLKIVHYTTLSVIYSALGYFVYSMFKLMFF